MLYDIDNNLSTEVNYSSSGGTWEGNSYGSSGAAYSFVDPNGGADVVYATDNNGSGLYRLQYESGTFTVSRVSTAAGASSKNEVLAVQMKKIHMIQIAVPVVPVI